MVQVSENPTFSLSIFSVSDQLGSSEILTICRFPLFIQLLTKRDIITAFSLPIISMTSEENGFRMNTVNDARMEENFSRTP